MKRYIRIICLLLAICGLLTLASCNKDKNGDDKETTEGDNPATKVEYTATEGLFVYYVYLAIYQFSEQELTEHNFDAEKSLKEQMYDDTYTWYDILMKMATDALTPLLIGCNAAAEDGVELNQEELAVIEGTLMDRRVFAAADGYELDEYLAEFYGNNYITEEVLQNAYELQALSQKYSVILDAKFMDELREDDIAEQISKSGDTNTTPTKNIGIISFSHEENSAEEVREQALVLLEELQDMELTAEIFEEFAGQHSEVSQGFHQNVAKDDMISEIDGWLYSEEASEVGALGLVVTQNATIIVYYESDGEQVNVVNAKRVITDKMYDQWYDEIEGKYNIGITEELKAGLELDF